VEVTAIGTAEASSVIQVKSQIGGELLVVGAEALPELGH